MHCLASSHSLLQLEVEFLYLRDLAPLIAALSVLNAAFVSYHLEYSDDYVLCLGSPLLVWFHIILHIVEKSVALCFDV
jgi:hypothetical protein